MKKVLILGTNDACHSRMMSSLIKHISFDRIDVVSAGITTSKINKYAERVLREIGIDVSKEESRSMNEFLHTRFDIIITTTEEARDKAKSLLSGSTKIHKEFDDPAKMKGSEIDKLNAYRELRDEMNEWLNEFIARHRLIQ